MASIPGVDYSSGHPGGAALAAAGIRFAARYLSHTPAKNLTAGEADDLAAHGVSCIVVWETTANRAGAGEAAGVQDALDAAAQAAACGQPPGRPIYFAVDYDANPATVVPYFRGAASVLGLARVGVYGGYRVVAYLLVTGRARWAWQTAAWSGGQWDPHAHIRQPATGLRINGVSCDRDTATATDYGQWMPGQTPTEEDMPLTADEWKKLDDLFDTKLAALQDTRLPSVADPSKTLYLKDHWRGEGLAAVVREQAAPVLTDAQLTALAAKVAASPVLAAAIARAVVDLEAKRLDS